MDNTCPIWGLPCQVFRPDADTYVVEGSIRTGGNYQMDVAARMGVGGLSDTEKAQLTSWLIEQRMAGNDWPRITERQVEYAKERMPLPVHERADRLLRYLAKHSPRVGRPLAIVPPTRGIELSIPNISETSESIFENCYSALAWSESTAPGEVGYLTDYLAGMGWITKGTT